MKTAQKILMIVAFIASIVMVVVWAICAGVFFVAANSDKAIDDYIIDHPDVTKEAVVILMMTLGIMFAIFGVCSLINAFLALKAKETDKKGLLVMNIVFGALSGVSVNIVGAIFGLIARNQKSRE